MMRTVTLLMVGNLLSWGMLLHRQNPHGRELSEANSTTAIPTSNVNNTNHTSTNDSSTSSNSSSSYLYDPIHQGLYTNETSARDGSMNARLRSCFDPPAPGFSWPSFLQASTCLPSQSCFQFEWNNYVNHSYMLRCIEYEEAVISNAFSLPLNTNTPESIPTFVSSLAALIPAGNRTIWTLSSREGNPFKIDVVFMFENVNNAGDTLRIRARTERMSSTRTRASITSTNHPFGATKLSYHTSNGLALSQSNQMILHINLLQDNPWKGNAATNPCLACQQSPHGACYGQPLCQRGMRCIEERVEMDRWLNVTEVGGTLDITDAVQECMNSTMQEEEVMNHLTCLAKAQCGVTAQETLGKMRVFEINPVTYRIGLKVHHLEAQRLWINPFINDEPGGAAAAATQETNASLPLLSEERRHCNECKRKMNECQGDSACQHAMACVTSHISLAELLNAHLGQSWALQPSFTGCAQQTLSQVWQTFKDFAHCVSDGACGILANGNEMLTYARPSPSFVHYEMNQQNVSTSWFIQGNYHGQFINYTVNNNGNTTAESLITLIKHTWMLDVNVSISNQSPHYSLHIAFQPDQVENGMPHFNNDINNINNNNYYNYNYNSSSSNPTNHTNAATSGYVPERVSMHVHFGQWMLQVIPYTYDRFMHEFYEENNNVNASMPLPTPVPGGLPSPTPTPVPTPSTAAAVNATQT